MTEVALMKSPHMFVSVLSLFMVLGLTRSPLMHEDQGRPSSPPGQAHGQSAKPSKPATPPKTETPTQPKTPPHSAAQHLAQQPKLAAKIQPLLPPGTDLQAASTGFKNLGQFIAAAHVSHNLNIPFDQLKSRMTGTNPKSLGQAIHELKPSEDASAEAKRAEGQARKDKEDAR